MQGEYDVNKFSGTVMVTRNDTVLMLKAYGLADQEWNVSNTVDTRYGLASITKQDPTGVKEKPGQAPAFCSLVNAF